MDHIDFNINNYNINDLEEFYKFTDKKYTEDDINKNIQIMKEKLFNCKEITDKLKKQINEFLNKSSIILLSNIKTNDTNHNFNPIKNTDLNTVYNYKYPSGIINPIERQTQTKTICINSLFRDNFFNTNSSSFDYIFPSTIENVIKMTASFVEVPIFWYDISSKNQNNRFSIKLFNVNNGSNGFVPEKTAEIIIEDGTYSSSSIIAYLNTFFYTYQNGLQFLVCSISETKSKFSIRAANYKVDSNSMTSINSIQMPFDASLSLMTNSYYSPDFYFKIIFNNTPFFDIKNTDNLQNPYLNYLKSTASILGFKNNEYTITYNNTFYDYTTGTTYNCYLESEYSYGRYVHQYLFLEINDYNKNFSTNSVISLVGNNNYVGDNIISVIPITNNSSTIMFNNNNDGIVKCREYFGPVRLKKLTIRILDQFGNVLDLNGYDYFIVLELEQLYTNYKTNS